MTPRNEQEKRKAHQRQAAETADPAATNGAAASHNGTPAGNPSHADEGGAAPSHNGNGATHNGANGSAPNSLVEAIIEATPPTSPSLDTRELMRKLKIQARVRHESDRQEAELLNRLAKEATQRARTRERLESDSARQEAFVRLQGLDPNRPITEIPALADGIHQVEFSTVQEGRAYVRIAFNAKANEYVYEVIEPQPTEAETQALTFLRETLVRTLESRPEDPNEWEQYITDAVERAILDHAILVDEVSRQRLLYLVLREFLGYGEIDALMRDPMIEDISCDGPRVPVYLYHRQYESIRTNVVFPDEKRLDRYVVRLAQRSGKFISLADPLLDATLPDGSRLQASLSNEVTTRGSTFTIRKFRSDPLTPPDLVRIGTMSAQMAAYFWLAMEGAASILFAGGTASGKTTTLNAVSVFIPPQKKIVSIEDTRELNLPHQNWIPGLTRSGFAGEMAGGKQVGTIDMYKLLEAALRQRPEHLIVGEVRGPEATTLFQAMASGHATYSTLHADSVASAVLRLVNPPINVPRVMLKTLDAVGVQVQVRVKDRMGRRIKDLSEIVDVDPESGRLVTNQVFSWDPATDRFRYLGKSHVLEALCQRNNTTMPNLMAEWDRRTQVIEWMVHRGLRKIDDVARIVAEYYRRPSEVMARTYDAEPEPHARGT